MQQNTPKALSAFQRTRRYALAAIIAIGGLGLIFVASSHDKREHDYLEMIGVVLIMVGIGGRLWSTLYIGGHKAATVIDTGPYSVMRNPLYFFSTVAASGVGMQTGSLVLGALFGFGCWLAFTIVTLREEKWLTANLGQVYVDYVNRVPRFFPKPSLYRDQKEVTFRPALLNRTWLDGLVFFISIPTFELVEFAQNSGYLPVLLRLP